MTVMKSFLATIFICFTLCSAFSQVIDGGGGHALMVCKGGEVFAVGENSVGQVGDSIVDTAWVFSKVPGVINIKQISVGALHSMALQDNGAVWVWGDNSAAQLVDGTASNRFYPIQVDSLGGKVKQVCAGWFHSLFLLEDSTVWGGGQNGSGELGISPPPVVYHRPEPIPSLTNVIKITSGDTYSMVLKADGTVWAFGKNHRGNLGDGTTNHSAVPVQVTGLNNVIDIEAGTQVSYALTADGKLWSWGSNRVGQLGTGVPVGNFEWSTVPVQVPLDSVVMIRSQTESTIALKADGTVWAWGENSVSQLGDGTATNRNSPVRVKYLQNIVEIGMASFVGFAIDKDGEVFTWGGSSYLLANDTVQQRLVPGPITPVQCNPVISLVETKPAAKDYLNIYPNPTTGILSIKTPEGKEIESLQVLGLTGVTLFEFQEPGSSVDLSHLSKGVYVLSFTVEGQQYSQKIVKE